MIPFNQFATRLATAGLAALGFCNAATAQMATTIQAPEGAVILAPALPIITATASGMETGVALTAAQKEALLGREPFRPGVYQIKPVHSGLCLSHVWTNGGRVAPFLMQQACPAATAPSTQQAAHEFAILPHPEGGYTVRPYGALMVGFAASLFRDYRIPDENGVAPVTAERMSLCATVARGVWIGASRIDVHPCDVPAGAPLWVHAGVDDQRFRLASVGGRTYRFQPWTESGSPGQCWSVAGASRQIGQDLVRWECNDGADQSFELIYVRALAAGLEAETLTRAGFSASPDGPRRLPKARGVDLQGGNYFAFETIDDQAAYCASRCLSENACVAYTWKASGFDTLKPLCELKSSIPTPGYRGDATQSRVISGVIRP